MDVAAECLSLIGLESMSLLYAVCLHCSSAVAVAARCTGAQNLSLGGLIIGSDVLGSQMPIEYG